MEKEVEMGTYLFSNGDKYEGEWKDDKMEGQGTYTFSMEIHTREAFQTINLMEQEHIKKITIHIKELGKITNIKVKNKNWKIKEEK